MAPTTPPAPRAVVESPLLRLRRFCESPLHVGLLIAGLSLALRVGLFAELSAGPCLQLHRETGVDMHTYDAWARGIVAGDWLSRDVRIPPAREVARQYLLTHPAEAAELAGARDPELALWSRWTGEGAFYMDPLYPYLVAATYLVTGADPRHVFVWQLALGIGVNLLVFFLARRFFGAVAGTIAGLTAALYSPLLYYEVLLLREVTMVFTALLLVWLTARAVESGRAAWWGALGIACGLAFLLKGTFVIEILGLWIGAAVSTWRQRPRAWRSLAAALAGAALAVSPLVARNLAVGVPPLAAAGNGAITFIAGNSGGYLGDMGFVVGLSTARIMGETGTRFLPAAIATLRTHTGVGSYLRQLWSKVAATFNWYEIPNNTNFYYFRLHSAVLRWLPVTFFLVGPLGLVGLALALRRWRELWSAYLLVVASFVPLLAFLTLSRLRLPLAIALIPFAAHATTRIAGWALARTRADTARAVAAAGCALLLLAWTGSGHADAAERIRVVDYSGPLDFFYGPAVDEAERRGDRARAVAILEEFLELEPPVLAALGPDHPAQGEWQKQAALFFALVRDIYADHLAAGGRAAEAERQRRRSAELKGKLRPASPALQRSPHLASPRDAVP